MDPACVRCSHRLAVGNNGLSFAQTQNIVRVGAQFEPSLHLPLLGGLGWRSACGWQRMVETGGLAGAVHER